MATTTVFGPDQEMAFIEARDQVTERYRATRSDEDVDTFEAEAMLEYKWGSGDGRIFEWRAVDLEALLLDHYPRKVLVEDAALLKVIPETRAFLEFLHLDDRLTGDPLPELVDSLDDLSAGFIEAMHDRSRFGQGKRIGMQMQADGVDLSAPGAVEAWMRDFNSRPRAERDALFDEPAPEPFEPITLPPDGELLAAASVSAVDRLAKFAEFVGEGRRLTQRGNIALEDGRALVGILGVADVVDPNIGERVFKTKSTAELPAVSLAYRWARAAGFVKVRHGRVSITQRGRSLGRNPLADWRAAFEAFPKAALDRPSGRWDSDGYRFIESQLTALAVELPEILYRAGDVDVARLEDAVWGQLEDAFVFDPDSFAERFWRSTVKGSLERGILAPLQDLGAIRRDDAAIALTPLGLWATNLALREEGRVAPIVGELEQASAEALLRACAHMPLDVAEVEIRRWIAARPDTAAAELAAAAHEGPLPMMALHALGFAGPAAEPVVREMLETELRQAAQLWLVQHGFEDPASLPPEVMLALFVEGFMATSDDAGEVEAVAMLDSLGGEDEQTRFVEGLVLVDHRRATEMLELIARYHPSRRLAKAARKTALKRRSAGWA